MQTLRLHAPIQYTSLPRRALRQLITDEDDLSPLQSSLERLSEVPALVLDDPAKLRQLYPQHRCVHGSLLRRTLPGMQRRTAESGALICVPQRCPSPATCTSSRCGRRTGGSIVATCMRRSPPRRFQVRPLLPPLWAPAAQLRAPPFLQLHTRVWCRRDPGLRCQDQVSFSLAWSRLPYLQAAAASQQQQQATAASEGIGTFRPMYIPCRRMEPYRYFTDHGTL